MVFSGAAALLLLLISTALIIVNGEEIFLEWHLALDSSIRPASVDQPVITINGKFPGPLINATTNDNIHVNVFNIIDEPVLFTWNGIQQRLNSWQDGVSGTNCGIQSGKNWTFVFQVKDQIGSFFYFPSLNFQKAAGGFGPIRVNNRVVIAVPFPQPDDDFDLLIGDWYTSSYKEVRRMLTNGTTESHQNMAMLMNGKGSYLNSSTQAYESFTVAKGKTYRFRVSNVGMSSSFNFRIQNHRMVVVETEGSYTDQTSVDSLDVHVGQSYSVLVTADQAVADYYIVASPKLAAETGLMGVGVLHYHGSSTNATGPIPGGPDPFDLQFSVDQAKSIKWNLTAGAARPNPQGSFNVSNVTISQTFMLRGSKSSSQETKNGVVYYTVNDVSYTTPDTPLKLADLYSNGSGVYTLDQFSTNSSSDGSSDFQRGVFVASGEHRGWLELVLINTFVGIDSWHLDGYGFFVVGYGFGDWTPSSRASYNIYDPVVRSTVQVYPKGWTAVYAYLDNPGMWNLRSQKLRNWYLGQELYLRVYDPDPNPAKEFPPPSNLLLCGIYSNSTAPPPPSSPNSAPPPSPSHASFHHFPWFQSCMVTMMATLYMIYQWQY